MIADRTVAPPELSSSLTEKLVYLPGSFYINDHKRYHAEEAIAQQAAGKASSSARLKAREEEASRAGVPSLAGGVLLANFNQQYKVTPQVFDAWMGGTSPLSINLPCYLFWLPLAMWPRHDA